MSPWLNSLIPGWVDLLSGRQSARTLHFVVTWLLVAFVFIYVFEVIVSGFWNHMRSMITGRYRRPPLKKRAEPSRRRFLARAFGATSAPALSGCDAPSNSEWFPRVLGGNQRVAGHPVRGRGGERPDVTPPRDTTESEPVSVA